MVILKNNNSESYIQSISVRFLLILMGFIVFSPFSTFLIMRILGFSLSLPEILLIPFVFLFRKRFHFENIKLLRYAIFFIFWLSLIFISIIADNYSLKEILGSSRSYFTLGIAYLLFSKDNNFTLNGVMFVSLGSILGWIFTSFFATFDFLSGNSSVIAEIGNMLAIPLLISISVLTKRNKILLISIVLCIILSLIAGMRRQILVFVVSLVLSYGFSLFFSRKKDFLRKMFFLLIFIITFLLLLPLVTKFLQENNPLLYYRVIEKTQMTFSGSADDAGDGSRIENMQARFKNFEQYIIPRGFVTRQTLDDKSGGGYIDFPLSELLYTFGIFGATLILIVLIIFIHRCYVRANITNNESVIFVIIGIIMFMLLFLEGTFLSSSYTTPFTGYCLGRLKYYSNLSFVIKRKNKIYV